MKEKKDEELKTVIEIGYETALDQFKTKAPKWEDLVSIQTEPAEDCDHPLIESIRTGWKNPESMRILRIKTTNEDFALWNYIQQKKFFNTYAVIDKALYLIVNKKGFYEIELNKDKIDFKKKEN